ncbi:putative ABC transport system ATP-binding protein [Natronobacillus azotifigens]|uniref:ABC transporter ATP-binding protein n=1 Tax=Natronobacillus azotifigens TaxID=472978 RepID=A0A9J6RGE4_9BACI|nr:ABC transporter ATP-binding protein [Natronobacillus azotifigens]MCZ0704510.1 ABC transporter ATP-binding protein [Natronobacillus azotifigens]
MPMISVQDINKFYHKDKPNQLHILKQLNFTVETGEMVAIMGTSGSGKSSLLNVLGCVDDFQSGSYYLDNTSISTLNDKQLSEIRCRKIGFVLQDFVLIDEETAIENVKTPLFFDRNYSFRSMKKTCMEALVALNIDDLASKKVNQLSGGQQQRVAIARAIVNKPQLLLADEPTGSLDSATSQEIINVLKDLNQQGMTIVIVTHDQQVAAQCQKVFQINDGQLHEHASVATLANP